MKKISNWLIILCFLVGCLTYIGIRTYKKSMLTVLRDRIFPYTLYTERIAALDGLNQALLAAGKEEMSKHKVVICGISRDNAKDFFVVRKHIEHLGKQFADYKIIVFENDSKDGTKELLSSWQSRNNKVKIISLDFHNKKRPNIQFLVTARNFYLEELDKSPLYTGFDIVIVIDMDMGKGIDIRGIQQSFSQINKWDGVCSNGITKEGKMWDAFAFRNDEFPQTPKEDTLYWSNTVPKIQKKYPVDTNMVEVNSCFGGLTIYKRDKIAGCRYKSEQDDCEHVAFHTCLKKRNNGRMFMNPAQIIRY